MTPNSPKQRSRIWTGLAFLILIGLCLVAVRRFGGDRSENFESAARANMRGVGLMDQFQYASAAEAFKEASELAPTWVSAKINLGIALYNLGGGSTDDAGKETDLQAAIRIFKDVLKTEPDNIHGHYNLGVVLLYLNELDDAKLHFTRVTELDPKDAHGWLLRARCFADASDSAEAKGYFEKALALNPYLNAARYSIAQHRLTDDATRTKLLNEFNELMLGNSDVEYVEKYTDMGRYSFVIGKLGGKPNSISQIPMFQPSPMPIPKLDDTLVADASKFKHIFDRFGTSIVRFDFNRDGRIDLLLFDTKHGLNLWENQGEAGFVAAEKNLGLPAAVPCVSAAVGDYDNDSWPDLALSSGKGIQLYRNIEGKRFEDVSKLAQLDQLTGLFLGVSWADIDLDGDLEMILCQATSKPVTEAIKLTADNSGSVIIMSNVGVSAPFVRGNAPPLSTAFIREKRFDSLGIKGTAIGCIITDIDGDLDLDLVLLLDGQKPKTIINDRLMRFSIGSELPGVEASSWIGGMVIDVNQDEQSDLWLFRDNQPPVLLVSTRDDPDVDLATRFKVTSHPAPMMKQAQLVDLDLDGRFDLVGLESNGSLVLLQAEGDGKFSRKEAFGDAATKPGFAEGFAIFEVGGDCHEDLISINFKREVNHFKNAGNGNSAIKVALSGIRERREPGAGRVLRANADGIGTRLSAQADQVRSTIEYTTNSAGLGQSLTPITLGIGKANQADVLRLRWPDAMIQAELNQRACEVLLITENNRKPTSCPVLLVWDGKQFRYITDFLGAGALGESGPDGSIRMPRPEESVRIDPGLMQPRDGKFVLKITEPMDEVLFLDSVQLHAIEHPKGFQVFPDERFATSGPQPSQLPIVFENSKMLFPKTAFNHRGEDIKELLLHRDGKRVSDFAKRSWLGYAEEHFVELNFGESLQSLPAKSPVYLILAGWTDYPFPESIYAATQAGVLTLGPTLEQKQSDGTWKVLDDLGFPAGLPRVMVKDVSGKIDSSQGKLRIRTNLQIHWDQIMLAPLHSVAGTTSETKLVDLPLDSAILQYRGIIQEYSPNGQPPIAYDDNRIEPVAVTRWKGNLTKTGSVTKLLRDWDDRLVIAGPGDEVIIAFNGEKLPPVAADRERTMILKAKGYTKDTAPTTVTGGTVGPIPFKGMNAYPYDAKKQAFPDYFEQDLKFWHTRPAGKR
jgi:hypothetical protein